MRVLVAATVLVGMVGVARAEPPAEVVANAVASRWLAGVKAGAGAAVAALGTQTASVHGAPCTVTDAKGRAAIAKAVPAWRNCLEFGPRWKTLATGPDWRDVEARVDEESFGTLHIRVGRDGQIRDVAIHWSWGGV